jgi:hypothetical protein
MAAACALAASMVAVPVVASAADKPAGEPAEKGKVRGIRFEASLQKDFNLVGPGSLSPSTGGASVGNTDPHGDIRIGYDLPMGLTPLLGIGFRRVSAETVVTPAADGADTVTRTFSGNAIDLAIEARFYMKKHKKGIQPFVWLEYNTSFLSAEVADDTDSDAVSDAVEVENNEILKYAADEQNHGEINLGFGMEFKPSKFFAVGGKWGLGIGLQGGDRNDPPGADDQNAIRTDINTIGTSAAVYGAWRI